AERLLVQEDTGDTVVLDVVTLGFAEVEELHGAFDPVQAVLGDHDLIHEGLVFGAGPGVVMPHRRDVDDTDVARPVDRVVDACALVADARMARSRVGEGMPAVALLPRWGLQVVRALRVFRQRRAFAGPRAFRSVGALIALLALRLWRILW